ncbi:MAG: acyl-CoA dehydratase activase [Candidatus Thermoplasmatota archaeon]|nr:acyl-CoA dehydratase activase [Candidatus Thermoplasmatota archaeon]
MTITAGIDLGSTYVKGVVMKDRSVVGYAVTPTGEDHDATARGVLGEALKMAGVGFEVIERITSTGYGRRIATFANDNISEISANARGVRYVGRELGVRTIIDIGGQDTKVIALDEDGKMINFAMNDKCAAGTGRFLEVLAREMNVPLDEMGPLSLKSMDPVDITTTCLVFAKSEVANLVFSGYSKEDIIMGIHRAVARRLVAMAKKVGINDVVFFDGGPARNIGMVHAMENELGRKMFVPPMPQIVTATGAALIASDALRG